jgi:DNA (cytosine-5)-methyltransferase 1
MKVGSLFAGIGGFDLGFERAGFEVAWCVEWDKAAQAVLRRRFPRAIVYGDITQVDPDELAPVDVVCGGFPCQDLSVAGRRAGLAGNRSGLFHDAMRIVRRLRPAVLVLENVPGLLSSHHGRDFATVLREVGEGWDCQEVAWRILDSRYFGVAQRRRRVFVVAGSRAGCAESILALGESVSWHPSARGEARKGAPADARGGAAPSGKWWDGGDLAASVTTHAIAFAQNQAGEVRIDEVIPTIGTNSNASGRATPMIAFHPTQDPISSTDGSTHALGCGSSQGCATVAVAVDLYSHAISGDITATLTCTGGGPLSGPSLMSGMSVRRLTPTECERLQGFPDGWTDGQADSHRYKQLGNAVTVNVAEWIARRTRTWMQTQ